LKIFGKLSKNHEVSNFMRIRRVGTELFGADGQTDMTDVIVALLSFSNASKNSCNSHKNPRSWFFTFQFKILYWNFIFMFPCILSLY